MTPADIHDSPFNYLFRVLVIFVIFAKNVDGTVRHFKLRLISSTRLIFYQLKQAVLYVTITDCLMQTMTVRQMNYSICVSRKIKPEQETTVLQYRKTGVIAGSALWTKNVNDSSIYKMFHLEGSSLSLEIIYGIHSSTWFLTSMLHQTIILNFPLVLAFPKCGLPCLCTQYYRIYF